MIPIQTSRSFQHFIYLAQCLVFGIIKFIIRNSLDGMVFLENIEFQTEVQFFILLKYNRYSNYRIVCVLLISKIYIYL